MIEGRLAIEAFSGNTMKYGLYTPNFGDCGEAATLVELAVECEASGWDGFFIWDHLQWPGMEPAVDP